MAWTGNFKYTFEVDQRNGLRVRAGINSFASEYYAAPGESFTTPAFIFTWTDQGKGQASRNLHNWARNYGVLDGNKRRLTLLNNWEATHTTFDEKGWWNCLMRVRNWASTSSCWMMAGLAMLFPAMTTKQGWATGRKTKRNCLPDSVTW
ncbi:alpha-galactosidase [Paraflavitalea speifideaquila]|uniref:alpha-galactosidase n=1 Tax=Paraflavitalea speifideaquila TaxID=3076558 RepID=UPI0028E29F68|nr:alpha-galactosidase [Paraflavitalea speifideiaquila]